MRARVAVLWAFGALAFLVLIALLGLLATSCAVTTRDVLTPCGACVGCVWAATACRPQAGEGEGER